MKNRTFVLLLAGAVLMLPMIGCGSFAPPQSCGEGIGGTADETLFADYFSSMDLILEATSEVPPESGDNGVLVSAQDSLAIRLDALKQAEVRACVQERAGGGGIPMDKSFSVQPGEDRLTIGAFGPGTYVVRVIMNGKLVRNLTFEVQ